MLKKKFEQTVIKLQKQIGATLSMLSGIVLVLNIMIVIQRHYTFVQAVTYPSVLVFLITTPLFIVSTFFLHPVSRYLHVILIYIVGIIAAMIAERGDIVGPFLIVFTLLLGFQYRFFQGKTNRKIVLFYLPYTIALGLKTFIRADYNYLNAALDFVIALFFAYLFNLIFRDEMASLVNEKKQLEDELARNMVFIQFGRNTSGLIHNVKSALHGIIGFSDILVTESTGDLAEYARLQNTSLQYLLDMIKNLNFAVQASQHYEETPTNLRDIIPSIITLQQIGLPTKPQTKVTSRFEGPCVIKASPLSILQILQNILSNSFEALDRQSGGNIHISCIDNHTNVELTVTDNGPGIPWIYHLPKQDCIRKDIFPAGRSTKVTGNGIGLMFVRDKMAQLRANLFVESSPEKTTFTLEFPSISASQSANQERMMESGFAEINHKN